MTHLTTLVAVLAAVAMCAGCNKDANKAANGEKAAEAPAAPTGCGTDYGDPDKQLCITLPKNYKVEGKIEKDELYSELIKIGGPDMGDGVTLTVGFTSTNWKTYDEQLAAEEKSKSSYGNKLEASGSTPGGGKWWLTSQGYTKTVSAIAKAPNGKAVMCSTSNTEPSATAIGVCKTLRPFPG